MQPQVSERRNDVGVDVLFVADVGSRSQTWLRGALDPMLKELLHRLFGRRRFEAILQIRQDSIQFVLHLLLRGAVQLPSHTLAASEPDADRAAQRPSGRS